jgi:hypothetical protein
MKILIVIVFALCVSTTDAHAEKVDLSGKDVSGVVGQQIKLKLKVAEADGEDLLLISGLSNGAILSVGVDAINGYWLLPVKSMEGLTLLSNKPGTLSLKASIINRNDLMETISKAVVFTVTVTVSTSAAGRLFDAAAALTGVALRNSYEGEARTRLEPLNGAVLPSLC